MDWISKYVVCSDWMLDIGAFHGSYGQTTNDAGRILLKKSIPFSLFGEFNFDILSKTAAENSYYIHVQLFSVEVLTVYPSCTYHLLNSVVKSDPYE